MLGRMNENTALTDAKLKHCEHRPVQAIWFLFQNTDVPALFLSFYC